MIVVIDGSSLARRIYHVIESEFNQEHFERIFLSKIKNVANFLKATHLIVSFSDYLVSERLNFNSNYFFEHDKSNDFHEQEQLLMSALKEKGFSFSFVKGYESRDIISTIHQKLKLTKKEMIIVSTDKTLFSLIDNQTFLYDPMPRKNNKEIIDSNKFKDKYGVKAAYFSDYLVLAGIKKYGFKGVSGIGEKTAAKLINKYENINTLIVSSQEINGKLGKSLRNELSDMTKMSNEFINTFNNLDLGFSLSESRYSVL